MRGFAVFFLIVMRGYVQVLAVFFSLSFSLKIGLWIKPDTLPLAGAGVSFFARPKKETKKRALKGRMGGTAPHSPPLKNPPRPPRGKVGTLR